MATIIGGDEGSGGFPKGWKEKCTGKAKENITKDSAIAAKASTDLETGTLKKLSFSENPASGVFKLAFSSDGVYLAVIGNSTPYLHIYKRSGDTFTKLMEPPDLPGVFLKNASLSKDGLYLALGSGYIPFIIIYKRLGDTFVKLTDITNKPYSAVSDISFSADGNYLAAVTGDELFVYKRSGDNFTRLSGPSEQPSIPFHISITADGTYIAVDVTSKQCLYIYKRSEDTITKLTELSLLADNHLNSLSFSADGIYLAVGFGKKPYVIVYKRSGDTFTKLSGPPVEFDRDDQYVTYVEFSLDGLYLLLVTRQNPMLYIYKRSGDNFTLIDRNFLNFTIIDSACFSPENDIIYGRNPANILIGGFSSRSYDIYNAASYIKPGTWDPSTKLGVAVENALVGSSCKVNLFPEINGK